ncbi:hypothetical protein [Streptomyces sp900105755]|uniref:Secreted protein n=1 Tax=Streptomyces sp. 900105755 TaxID=3154389 RepID=A0ABV1TSQ1_9ACTN
MTSGAAPSAVVTADARGSSCVRVSRNSFIDSRILENQEMISVAQARFSQYAVRAAALTAALLASAGCSDGGSSARQSVPPTAAHASEPAKAQLPTLESLKSPAPSGKLLVAQTGQGGRQFEVPLTKTGSQLTVRLICVGPGAVKVTDGAGGRVLNVGGCSATAAYTTSFTGAKSDRVLRLAVRPSVSWRVLVWG